jgi:hypothetical protein
MATDAPGSGVRELRRRSQAISSETPPSTAVLLGLSEAADHDIQQRSRPSSPTKTAIGRLTLVTPGRSASPTHKEEVNTMNTILDNIEEILDGVELEVIDMPVYNLPDYLPRMDGGGSGAGGQEGC